MKIEDLVLFFAPSGRAPSTQPEQGEFALRLREALTCRNGREAEGAPSLGGLGQVTPAGEGMDNAAAAVEPALARLEAFAQGLENSTLSLKDLAPLAQELEKDSRRLAALSRSLAPASPLRPMVEEAATLAYVESVKFQRGDYL